MEKLINLTITDLCLKCKICCRFLDKKSDLAPKEFNLKKKGVIYVCQAFNGITNTCTTYFKRPVDCRMYPFVVTESEDKENILVALDKTCPNHINILNSLKNIDFLSINIPLKPVVKWNISFIPIKLVSLTGKKSSGLNVLTIDSCIFFKQFLINAPNLSAYSFVYHFMWDEYAKYSWKIINGSFCLFSRTGKEFFMPMAPLNLSSNADKVLKECFNIMNTFNKNKEVSRIENIHLDTMQFFSSDKYKKTIKDEEYIYETKKIAELKGDKFKAFRWLCNKFEKENKFHYEEFSLTYLEGCIKLLNLWYDNKIKKVRTHNEQFLLYHAVNAHKKIFTNYENLGITGRVLRINNEIVAYTFGSPLNSNTFCIFTEVGNPAFKGASQFIFKQFCSQLTNYKYINTMGDEGIENLRLAKSLYKPAFKEINYIITVSSPEVSGSFRY